MFIYGIDKCVFLNFTFDFKYILGDNSYPLYVRKFNFFRALFDSFRDKKLKNDISGIYIYCGLFGMGKTYSAVRDIIPLKQQGFSVYSNFGLTFQDGFLKSWKDILSIPPNSVIFIDEISDTFNNRSWAKMPRQIFTYFVQNRKMNIRIVCTAQCFDEVDKSIRTKAKCVIDCLKWGRIGLNRYYSGDVYMYKKKRPDRCVFYNIEDYFVNYYNTNEFVKSLTEIVD